MTLLNADHLKKLVEERSIALALVEQRGYQSLPQPEDLIDRGFSKAQAKTAPALGIPLWDVHGHRRYWQIRPDCPRQFKDGRLGKYEVPTGEHLILDVHPSVQPLIGNPHEPLWITEGVPKADSLASRGVCAIALNGVRGYRGTNDHGGKVILPDWEHVALNGREVIVVYDSDIAWKPDVDRAVKALYRLLRERSARPRLVRWPEAYLDRKVGLDDFLAGGGTLEELLAMLPPMGPLPISPAQKNGHGLGPVSRADVLLTDTSNAAAFVADHGPILRYCYCWKTWLVWTGTHWQRDVSGKVMRLAKQTVKNLAQRITTMDDEKQIAELFAHIKASLSTAKLKAMIENAQSEQGIAVQPDQLDADPWVVNVANGTLNLKTGELQPHQQQDLLTKCLSIPYDAEARCPQFIAFLEKAMGGDATLIVFLQRALGYSLTGSTREQCFFLLHGPTKTGKSTFINIAKAALGPYATQAETSTFLHKDRETVRNDLADLAGMRLVSAIETDEGKRLAEALIKQLTGGTDTVKARFLFEEYFEFRPQFKVFLATNHLPKITAQDDAIWERVHRVPFVVQIPKDERDKQLEDKLREELPGILAWMVRGCLAWQRDNDLLVPAAVTASTQQYREEMDDVGRFLTEVCLLDKDHYKVQASTLLKAYHQWCGQTTMTGKAFAKQLTDKGYTAKHSNTGTLWYGIGLPSDASQAEDKKGEREGSDR
jgi:putative DNA primase/helicase